ncbi:MAG TPA: hypothetical protein VGG15_10770 [Terriglobales bacterium]|jgi:hypothetical protein
MSEGTDLTDAWVRLSPKSRAATTGPVSEVFIVFPESSALSWTDGQLVGINGARVVIEGYLDTNGGALMPLTTQPMTLNGTLMLDMTNPVLQWSKSNTRIKSIMLRSSVPVKTKKIIWVSDDPRDNKDGVVAPEER